MEKTAVHHEHVRGLRCMGRGGGSSILWLKIKLHMHRDYLGQEKCNSNAVDQILPRTAHVSICQK